MTKTHTPHELPRLGGELRSAKTAQRLLEELRSGTFAAANQLPSELELAEQLGVSRTVVRDALSELERSGYVERVRGIGTVVNRAVVGLAGRMDQKLEFYRMIREAGYEPHSDDLTVTREKAGPELAARLKLPSPDDVLLVVRRRVLADARPVLYSTDMLPLALFEGKHPERLDFSRPIFDLVREVCATEVTSTVAHLRAVAGTPLLRRQLALGEEQALLQLDEVCYSRLCRPVLCCRTCYTDFFDFAMVRKLL